MLVKVIYKNDMVGGFTGRAYTYRTTLPLNDGDIVLAPVSGEKEPKRAMVVEINVPESEIDPSWADAVKTITKYDTPLPESDSNMKKLRQNIIRER